MTRRHGIHLLDAIHIVMSGTFAAAIAHRLLTAGGAIGSDFMVFRSGWWLILHGEGAHLYDADWQRHAQHLLMDGRQFEGGLMAFLNPPHVALAGAPLGWIADTAGFDTAFLVWTALNVLLVARLVWLLQTVLPARELESRRALTLAVVAFFPVFYTLFVGQVSILLAVAALELFRAVHTDRPRAAALWLLVLSVKPQLVPPFLVLLLVRRSWTVIGWSAAAGAGAAAAAAIALGPEIWVEYVRNLHGLEKFFAAGTPDYMLNLRGLLARAAPMLSANAVYTLSCTAWLAAIGLLASALARGRRTGESHLDRDFARTTAVALLFCPHLFLQDAVLWTVPLVLYVAAAPADAKAAAGLARVLVLFPLVFAAAQAVDVWTANRLVVNPVVLLTVALWLVCERSVRLPVDPLRCEADALP